MSKEIIFGGEKIRYLQQFNSSQYTLSRDGTRIKALVDKTTQDGTGVTPHKRRNEISFRNGANYNYWFKLNINGSQKNEIANLWQIKTKGDKYPRISLGVKRIDNKNKLAYKIGSQNSKIIDEAASIYTIYVDCKVGELHVNGKKIAKFNSHSDENTITKFGIEADKDCVDCTITAVYTDIKLTKK
jgi:hypothetical protein